MKHALCIGINDYPGTDADLQGCVNDAHDWSQVLQNRGFQSEVLLNERATLHNIRRRMEGVVDQAHYGDTVVITYSGHGTWVPDADNDEPDGRDEALCPHDISESGPLTDDDLYEVFTRRSRGVRLVFISDSCHSGSVNRLGNFGHDDPVGRVRFLAPETYLKERDLQIARSAPARPVRTLPSRATALLMSGCADYEYSYDAMIDGRFNGAFTYVALRTLNDLPKTATYRDWMREIRRSLPSMRYPQSPILSGSYNQRIWPVLS